MSYRVETFRPTVVGLSVATGIVERRAKELEEEIKTADESCSLCKARSNRCIMHSDLEALHNLLQNFVIEAETAMEAQSSRW